MLKKILTIAGLAVATAALPTMAYAEGSQGHEHGSQGSTMGSGSSGSMGSHDAKSKKYGAADSLQKQGLTVQEVDKDNRKVTFEASLAQGATITEGGKKIALDSLQVGDEVRASFNKKGEIIKLTKEKQPAGSRQPSSLPSDQPGSGSYGGSQGGMQDSPSQGGTQDSPSPDAPQDVE